MPARVYIVLSALVFALLFALILWGPLSQQDAYEKYMGEDSRLWEESWQVIERWEKEEDQYRITRFIRKPGFSRDTYYIAVKDDRKESYKRYHANYRVRSIFSDWRRPQILAYYKKQSQAKGAQASADKAKEKYKERGLDQINKKLVFYKAPSSKPVLLILGEMTSKDSGRIFARSSLHSKLDFILPSYLLNKLKYDSFDYRSRKVIQLQAKEEIESLQLRINSSPLPQLEADAKSAKHTVKAHRFHFLKEKKDGRSSPQQEKWYLTRFFADGSRAKDELAAPGMGRSFASRIANLSIAYFEDSKETSANKPLAAIWEKAQKDLFTITLQSSEDKSYLLRARLPLDNVKIKAKQLALAKIVLKASSQEYIYWIGLQDLAALKKQLARIEQSLQEQKKRKEEAAKTKRQKKSERPGL